MRISFRFLSVFVALVCVVTASVLPGRAQTEFPRCLKDGSIPAGEAQCECDPWIYRGELHDAKHGYDVRLPDKVVAFGPCSPGGAFQISLTNPTGNKPDGANLPWNMIWIGASEGTRETLQRAADGFAQNQREDVERDHATDLEIDQPLQYSLSSLPAIHLKATRTDLDRGKLAYEVVVANNPEQAIVYVIGMVSPASRYEKNHALFEAVVKNFKYIPTETAKH